MNDNIEIEKKLHLMDKIRIFHENGNKPHASYSMYDDIKHLEGILLNQKKSYDTNRDKIAKREMLNSYKNMLDALNKKKIELENEDKNMKKKTDMKDEKNKLLEKIEYFTSMGIEPCKTYSVQNDTKDLENILLIQMNKFDKKQNPNKDKEIQHELLDVLFGTVKKYGQSFIEKNIDDDINKEKSSELLNLVMESCHHLADEYINKPTTNKSEDETNDNEPTIK